MSDVKHAVFIEPHGEFAEQIRADKQRVEQELPGQPYGNHPPHATLYVSELRSETEAEQALTRALRKVAPFAIQADRMLVFENDVLAGGGQTLAYGVRPEARLSGLQRLVAEALCGLRTPETQAIPPAIMGKPVLVESWEKYGFPFVGEHWIAHFTIASLQVGHDHAILTALSNREVCFAEQVASVSLWRIAGEEHIRVCELSLWGEGGGCAGLI